MNINDCIIKRVYTDSSIMGNSQRPLGPDIDLMNYKFTKCNITCHDIYLRIMNDKHINSQKKNDDDTEKQFKHCLTDCRKGYRLLQQKILLIHVDPITQIPK